MKLTREEIIAELTGGGPFELAEDTSTGYPIRFYKNAPTSLIDVFHAAPVDDSDTSCVLGTQDLTYGEVRRQAAALAEFLAGLGVCKGDRVAVGMRNYPEWLVSFWACQAIGAVVVALNAWWTTPELSFALADSTPCVLIVDGERLERILPLLLEQDALTVIVAHRDGAPAGGLDFADAIKVPAEDSPPVAVFGSDLATILYTSGTTGRSKGAVATQRNHITNLMNILLNRAVALRLIGAPVDIVLPQIGTLQTLPFFHIGGLSQIYISAALGSKLVLMHKWNPVEGVDLIEAHGLTAIAGVPIVVRQMLDAASASGKSLSTLASVGSGGAPVPPGLIRRIETQFRAQTSAGSGYGLTETTSAIIFNSGADYFAHPDSVGRLVPTCDVRVVDDEGHDKVAGEIGELWIRGANVGPGYWRNPDATEASFGGGWFRSGDLGYVDAEGLYYVVDRKKDVVIRGGENVYCAEVEAALLEQTSVKDACVVGVAHEAYGEEVAAVIQTYSDAAIWDLEREIVEALIPRLAKFKIPSRIAFTRIDLPRTATGKVLKAEVRARYFSEAAAPGG